MTILRTIGTPDGITWEFTRHAQERMKLYKIKDEDAINLLYNGDSTQTLSCKSVYKIFTKRHEMVVDVEKNKIITIYIR